MSVSLELESSVRINRQILYFKLSHSIFCTKALHILSQKRVLKRNEFVGYRKEKLKRKTKRNGKKKKTVKHVRVSESSETSHDVSWPAWPG